MRVILLAPLLAVFGCAHEAATSAQSAQPAVAEATPTPPPAPTPPPDTASKEQAAAKPPRLACAPIKVHFALDSDQLYDSEKPLLDVTAKCLSANDAQRVTIVGNADERGSVAYNQDLGQRRADAVAQYLESKGASATQIEAVVSHGEESPICLESNLKCWQLNRRTAVRETCHL
ncbi:MAG: OmpA family protein [Polyangia bacterium]